MSGYTHIHTHKTTTVTLGAHACLGSTSDVCRDKYYYEDIYVHPYNNTH